MTSQTLTAESKSPLPDIVIVGGGFAGIAAAREFGKTRAKVTIIDRTNHHLFQPLLYQVATAELSVGDIATPIRQLVRDQANTTVVMGEVTGIDTEKECVYLGDYPIYYEYLILATGAKQSYFGKDEWEEFAPGLKTVQCANKLRNKILKAFELAELQDDPEKHRDILTFLLVGGGPTGVEMAGAIAEIAQVTLRSEFRRIDPSSARIILVQAAPRLLPSFPEKLSQAAYEHLTRMGVEVMLNSRAEHIDEYGVIVNGERIACRNVIWAAGVQASPAAKWLNVESDRAGHVKVLPNLSVEGYPNIFAVGDTATIEQDGKPLPGLAQVAMQSGKYAAQIINSQIMEKPAPQPFRYVDLGTMATVGRSFAVMDAMGLSWSGFPAKIAWLLVHIAVLNQMENRISTLFQWSWSIFTQDRGFCIIEDPVADPFEALPLALTLDNAELASLAEKI